MATKRFSRLRYGLTMLQNPTTGASAGDPPAGSVAAEFKEFISGEKNISYTRDAASKPGSIEKVSVLPFYFAGATGKETIVSQSARADTRTELDGVQTACNQIAADLDTHSRLANFIPAKAVVFDYSGTTTAATSQITGLRYDKRNGASYTFPYGASATEQAERNVRQDILTAVQALGTASVSFTSEKI